MLKVCDGNDWKMIQSSEEEWQSYPATGEITLGRFLEKLHRELWTMTHSGKFTSNQNSEAVGTMSSDTLSSTAAVTRLPLVLTQLIPPVL